MSMATLSASVIINTCDRAAYLRRLLPSLERQQGVRFEIVVVNGPSTDDTAALLRGCGDRLKTADCPERNLSLSRNIGIAASAGDVIVFVDDDALPCDEHWLRRFVDAFAQNERLGAAGGMVLFRDTPYHEFNGGESSDYGFQIFGNEANGGKRRAGQRWFLRVPGNNCAFRRTALVQAGGFDEYFTYYIEEADMSLRLFAAGWEVAYLPDNPIRHYPAVSERRTSTYDRNWDVVARSDTYFALKNSAGPLPARALRTLLYAPQKHYVAQINGFLAGGEITPAHWLRLTRKWASGASRGFRDGLVAERRLATFARPPALRQARLAMPPRRLSIALLAEGSALAPGDPAYDLAGALHDRGHTVHLLCQDAQPLRHERLGLTIHGVTAATAPSGLEEHPALRERLAYALALQQKLEELFCQGVPVDLVHVALQTSDATPLIRAGLYPTLLGLPALPEHAAAQGDQRLLEGLRRWQILHADAVWLAGPEQAERYRRAGLPLDQQPQLHTGPALPAGLAVALETVYLALVERLAAERAARRERTRIRSLPLDAGGPTTLLGVWQAQEAVPGERYLTGGVGAQIGFSAHGGTPVRLVLLRHPWSGVLQVCVDGATLRYVDLYKPGLLEYRYVVEFSLPASEQPVAVTLRVHPERNPESFASQVWLKEIVAAWC
ncbi:MAG: hypothetical protein OHK0022_41560 [Roseiflexaceae bacterium]